MRNYFGWLVFFSVAWWLVLLPYDYHVLSVPLDVIHAFAYSVITQIAGPYTFQSDSSGMYLLLLICPVLGAVTALSILLPGAKKLRERGLRFTAVLMRYFIVLELWKYGWIKLIKLQFYLPEPNTLYSPLGDLSKDIAYWSVIGSSHSYVVFMGLAEVIAGTMLLFTRTRFAGLLLALGIFVNVLMVNISFDISVKLFVITTLAMVAGLLADYPNQFRYLFGFPVKEEVKVITANNSKNNWLHALIVSVFVVEAIYPAVIMEHVNDDAIARPAHHGAYAVLNHASIRRLFVHRQGYIILENAAGERLDLKITSANNAVFALLNERDQSKSSLTWNSSRAVTWKNKKTADTLYLKELPYRELPLLQDSFHWFSDDFH